MQASKIPFNGNGASKFLFTFRLGEIPLIVEALADRQLMWAIVASKSAHHGGH